MHKINKHPSDINPKHSAAYHMPNLGSPVKRPLKFTRSTNASQVFYADLKVLSLTEKTKAATLIDWDLFFSSFLSVTFALIGFMTAGYLLSLVLVI